MFSQSFTGFYFYGTRELGSLRLILQRMRSGSEAMAKLLIIEDEPRMVVGLRDNFEYEGYEVITAEDGSEGIKRALHDSPDLILLDVMLPRISGLDVCLELKAKRPCLPIIMLTARCQVLDRVIGLELGADDYVTKPFSIRELSARVKALLRRVHSIAEKRDVSGSPCDLESDTLESDSEAAGKARISGLRLVRKFLCNRNDAFNPDRLVKQNVLAERLRATRPSDLEKPSSADNTFAMIGRQLGHYRILSRRHRWNGSSLHGSR
jgi:DNA-binding response OmpR family regulator